jgi:hypothetical protein
LGPTGITGTQGEIGATGEAGITGEAGPTGQDGVGIRNSGDVGSPGLLPVPPANPNDCYYIGDDLYIWNGSNWVNVGALEGDAGPQGLEGPMGPEGSIGPIGPQGSVGEQGANGPAGAAGPAGPRGATGATGPAGPAGPWSGPRYYIRLSRLYTGPSPTTLNDFFDSHIGAVLNIRTGFFAAWTGTGLGAYDWVSNWNEVIGVGVAFSPSGTSNYHNVLATCYAKGSMGACTAMCRLDYFRLTTTFDNYAQSATVTATANGAFNKTKSLTTVISDSTDYNYLRISMEINTKAGIPYWGIFALVDETGSNTTRPQILFTATSNNTPYGEVGNG